MNAVPARIAGVKEIVMVTPCTPEGKIAYIGKVTWLECPRDDQKFFGFLDQALTLLEQPEPPPPSPTCVWCAYRESARQTGL